MFVKGGKIPATIGKGDPRFPPQCNWLFIGEGRRYYDVDEGKQWVFTEGQWRVEEAHRMNREAARRVVGDALLARAWEEWSEANWDEPDDGVNLGDWHAALEYPFIHNDSYTETVQAFRILGATWALDTE
jgi:hypothetical protein